ncbi:MAG: DUF3575 domain-containing protein, partial [Bacteroidales bacterium]
TIEESLKQQLSQAEYKALIRNYYPSLRIGEIRLTLFQKLGYYRPEQNLETYSDSILNMPSIETHHSPIEAFDFPSRRKIQPLALKTNLLFDLATALNVELEIPIAKRWSIAGEWIFPWWLWESKQYCFELLSGTMELKYWFPKHKQQLSNNLNGWFVGLYAGGGLYDLEWDKVGYQGEFYIAAGVSAGYAHKINPYLSMEYSLGLGYLSTDYRKYRAERDIEDEWHLYRESRGRYSFFGPTKLKVSLVWRPVFYKKIKKGGKR